MYHNTNRETGDTLTRSRLQACSQEHAILSLFIRRPAQCLSPDDVSRILFADKVPITSVRRAITELTKDGVLIKTRHMKTGRYGKQTHTWMLRGE